MHEYGHLSDTKITVGADVVDIVLLLMLKLLLFALLGSTLLLLTLLLTWLGLG